MAKSRTRPISWANEYHILRDDMPREFRKLLADLQDRKSSRGETYALALEGLGAMTYAVAMGTVAAQLRDHQNGHERLWAALQEPGHQALVSALDKDEHYVQICVETLSKLLETVDRERKFSGILNDIVELSPKRPSNERLIERLQEFRKGGSADHYEDIAELNNKFYDLVSSLFGYWPKYALGVLEVGKKSFIHFDTDELGSLAVRPSQVERFRFTVADLPATFGRIVRSADGQSADEAADIDLERVRTVFLADLDSRKLWMISPFVINYKSGSKAKDSEYLFLDPTWSGKNDNLSWRRFNSALGGSAGRAKRGTALAAEIQGDRGSDWARFHERLLGYPFELKLDDEQHEQTFFYLENELKKVRFTTDNGQTYEIAEKVASEPRIFYRTGASLYVEVVNSAPRFGNKKGDKKIAKLLLGNDHPAASQLSRRRGFYEFEKKRFDAEIKFLKNYFAELPAGAQVPAPRTGADPTDEERIGAGIVASHGRGKTQSDDEKAYFAGRPFYLREPIDRSLRDFINDVATEPRPTDPQRETIWLMRRIMRALYIIERAAATLALIYSKAKSKSDKDVHFIHRDIRPEVLLYPGFGVIKICDFTAAFFPDSDDEPVFFNERGSDGTQDNVMLDSYGMSSHYCAPEVYDMPNIYSPTADVFSLGMVLNELLNGSKKNVQRYVSEWQIVHGPDRDWGDLLFDKPGPKVAAICDEIESFAARKAGELGLSPNEAGRYLDLAALVGKATCHHSARLSMDIFRNRVASASHVIRYYLAEQCRAVIEQSKSGSSESLEYALKFASWVFGQDSHVRKPLAMVRCAVCHHCEQYNYDSAIENYRCHAQGMKNAIADLDAVVRSSSRGPRERDMAEGAENRLELSHQEALRALEAIDDALEICPGIMDRVPEELDATLNPTKLAPHTQFYELGLRLFKPSGIDELNVVSRGKPARRQTAFAETKPYRPSKPAYNSTLAMDLFKLIVRASGPRNRPLRW